MESAGTKKSIANIINSCEIILGTVSTMIKASAIFTNIVNVLGKETQDVLSDVGWLVAMTHLVSL
jgi:hypothetical protein